MLNAFDIVSARTAWMMQVGCCLAFFDCSMFSEHLQFLSVIAAGTSSSICPKANTRPADSTGASFSMNTLVPSMPICIYQPVGLVQVYKMSIAFSTPFDTL